MSNDLNRHQEFQDRSDQKILEQEIVVIDQQINTSDSGNAQQEPDMKKELLEFMKDHDSTIKIQKSQEVFKNDLREALKELQLDQGEEYYYQEYKQAKLSPVKIAVCYGGVAFGGYILLSTALNRKNMTSSIRLGRYGLGMGLIVFNLVHLARSQFIQRPKPQNQQDRV
ncbi:UNKNOWN [Stylonychia lemnae]|uniref:Transmembrane protein n=1 Tax=Stylonychia lemnae TaxID=5949 RepID=A0A077ZRL1_STYLE|nr:UNKNOWN [Stylonychia lemnae]|eukprot:CDW72104.1 UNKNOWN [Stylonychia lemnae]